MKLSKFKDRDIDCYMLRVTREEALDLVGSLVQQMRDKTPNSGRLESYTVGGEYFSIAVDPNGM
jgi:hypothetical protein